MSCYGWEKGSITIPAKEWKNFKTNLHSRLQARQDKLLSLAQDFYNQIKNNKLPIVKNEGNIYSFINEKLNPRSEWGQKVYSRTEVEKIADAVFNKKTKRLTSPKKNLFKVPKNETHFRDDDLDVSLDKRVVTYETDDNNHSIDDAKDSFLGTTVRSLLKSVNYTGKTGGIFHSRTEYDSEIDGARVSFRVGYFATEKAMKKELFG